MLWETMYSSYMQSLHIINIPIEVWHHLAPGTGGLFWLQLLGYGIYIYTVKTLEPYFGHLSCLPVVYITHYKLQGMLPI